MLKAIGEVAVFIICAQTLLHFRAKESYEKYVKLLISMMVLLFLLKPFLNWGYGNEDAFFWEVVAGYQEQLGKDVFSIETEQGKMEEIVMSMAQTAVAQEELQENEAEPEAEVTGSMGKNSEESKDIQVERIQIGD